MSRGGFNAIPWLLDVGNQLCHVHVIEAATDVAKVGEQCFGRQMVEPHHLLLDFDKPFVVDRLNNLPVKVVLNSDVSFVFNAFSLAFRDLSFSDDFVQVNNSRVRSGVCRDQKPLITIGEGDALRVVNYHANVTMLSASILGCNAASGIG